VIGAEEGGLLELEFVSAVNQTREEGPRETVDPSFRETQAFIQSAPSSLRPG